MNTDDAFKILGEVAEKDKKETEALKNMSDTDFCAKMISYLGKELSEEQKGYGYGPYPVTISYNEIKTTFEHDKLDTEEALLYFRSYFYSEILNFCGCGCPSEALDFVLYFLNCFVDEQWKETILLDRFSLKECLKGLKGFDDESGIPCVVEFMLHYLDKLELSEHGSSVYGSWLTDAGIMWREVLRRTEGVDI